MAIEGWTGEAREACNRFAKVMTNCSGGRPMLRAASSLRHVHWQRWCWSSVSEEQRSCQTRRPSAQDRFLTAPRVWGRVHTPIGHLVLRS